MRQYSKIFTAVALGHALLFLSCAKIGGSKPADGHAQAQTQTMSDMMASSLMPPVAFKDSAAIKNTLSTLSRSDTDCAVVIDPKGAPISRYERPQPGVTADRLAAHLKKNLSQLRSAYSSDLDAYVAISPINDGPSTIAYVALARK